MRKFFGGLAAVGFVALLVWFSLNSSKTLATTSGGKITEDDFYSSIKSSADGQQLFSQMVIDKVLENKFKDAAKEKDVNDAYILQRAQYGTNFNSFLSANNQTEDSYKTQIKSNMLMQQAVLDKYEISNEDLQAAYDKYTPTVDVSFIPVNDEETARAIVDQANGGADFASLAKQYSTDATTANNGGKVPSFDSTSPQITTDLMDAINATDEGKTAEPYQTDAGWLVIRVNKKTAKSDNLNDYKDQLRKSVIMDFMSDSANQKAIQDIIGAIMKESNVSVKERDLAPAVAGYLDNK